jgi:hypothetical protein
VALLLNGDDPPAAGEDWEHSAEGDLNGRSTAVKQDKRHTAPATMQLVVDLDAVDRRVATFHVLKIAHRIRV